MGKGSDNPNSYVFAREREIMTLPPLPPKYLVTDMLRDDYLPLAPWGAHRFSLWSQPQYFLNRVSQQEHSCTMPVELLQGPVAQEAQSSELNLRPKEGSD